VAGEPTGEKHLYSIVGALDPNFNLPDDRLLCVPTNDKEKELAFPSPAAAGWGNATFLAMCMKLAYEVSPQAQRWVVSPGCAALLPWLAVESLAVVRSCDQLTSTQYLNVISTASRNTTHLVHGVCLHVCCMPAHCCTILPMPDISQDWKVVRDVVEHEWRHASLYNTASPQAGTKRFLKPRFIQGCSFNFMQPAGAARWQAVGSRSEQSLLATGHSNRTRGWHLQLSASPSASVLEGAAC
jgi:hypothetical protein